MTFQRPNRNPSMCPDRESNWNQLWIYFLQCFSSFPLLLRWSRDIPGLHALSTFISPHPTLNLLLLPNEGSDFLDLLSSLSSQSCSVECALESSLCSSSVSPQHGAPPLGSVRWAPGVVRGPQCPCLSTHHTVLYLPVYWSRYPLISECCRLRDGVRDYPHTCDTNVHTP